MNMKDLYSFLDEQSQHSSFNAELSKRGGFITFSNSGRRGEIKYFQIGLDSILQTLKDILDNLNVFNTITEYEEKAWRDSGSEFFKDPVANANSTVQTKPLFSTLSKVIIWGNQPRLNDIDPDKTIVLDEFSLTTAIKELEMVADSFRPKQLIQKASNNLPLQQIFYGAPGTGKSNTIKREVDNKGLPCVRTTFHPDSDYSTFVGAYKPTSIEVPVVTMIGTKAVSVENPNGSIRTEKKIVYEFVPQAFLKAYTGAWKNQGEPFFLIIEEINRGNCAQIFGDLFQLLDRNDETGLSDYPISPDEDIQKFLLSDKKYGFATLTDEQKIAIPEAVQTGELMILPSNLHIWATMNTSDQSLFPIDSAFKRRWDWKYIPISDGKKGWRIKANGKHYDWWQFLQKINDQIGSTTNSEDKKLGYYFCKAKNGIIDAETFVGKVMFYVWNDVYKDFAEEAGDLFKDIDGSLLSFSKFYTIGKDGNTEVVEEKIEIFLQNLGVPILDYLYTEDDSPLLDENGDELDENSNEVAVIGKRNFDYTKYSINGKGVYPKGRVAKEAISLFVSMHPDMTAEEIVKVWLDLNIKISNMVETSQMFESRTASSADPGLHSRYKTVTMPNGEILYVSNQYNVERINDFISKVNSQDWDIHIESIEE